MSGIVKNLFGGGGDKGAKLAKQEAAAASRRQLAALAKQQADVDQAAQGQGGRRKGRQLLSFLGAEGNPGLSAA
ncbi:MAG: hypothetical protein RJB58_41 [Pseudomonadota bacterium]|jgi:hypothetical protein